MDRRKAGRQVGRKARAEGRKEGNIPVMTLERVVSVRGERWPTFLNMS